ncbi:DUF523 domain-containing protein [Candidatus Poribacteria bacterium]|nr:DUF523 domain-containing protein [Candidatus Poribacteria bacterium]
MKIVVSACLIGTNCRYDGGNSKNLNVINLTKNDDIIPVCPEEAGGLPTPRPAVEIVGGDGNDVLDGKAKVLTVDGKDKTAEFIKGAQYALDLILSEGVKKVILKSRSPSCGCGEIYDGSFNRNVISGDGVTTALLKRHGIEVVSM